MPFGRKTDAAGRPYFDAVYREIIAPAVSKAGLDPIRADEEKMGGTIHKPMFERLMLCNYAGGRHHRRQSQRLLRARHPARDAAAHDRDPVRGGTCCRSISRSCAAFPTRPTSRASRRIRPPAWPRLPSSFQEAHDNPHDDSPFFQLIDEMPRTEVEHSKTDISATASSIRRNSRRGSRSAAAGEEPSSRPSPIPR